MKAHVATCVAIERRGILIEGPPGCGKSALALALIDRGAVLVGDDGVLLETIGTQLIAHPHLTTHGLLEIRNLGLVSLPVREAVTIALVIALDPGAPRFIDTVPVIDREGVALPCVAIWPDSNPPVLKVEQALRLYGLRI
jgi:hypothetical protein